MSRSGHPVVVLLTAFFALLVYAAPQITAQEYLDYCENSSMDLGAGYDFMGHSIRRSALKETEKTSAGKGLTGETTLQYIETSSELSQKLHVGAEGTYSSVLFNVSAKADFVKDVQVNEYSLNFLLYSRYSKSSEFFKQPTLSDDAKKLLENKDFETFRRCYGDHYLSAITSGGEFVCLIQIHTSDENEKTKIEEEMNANGVNWSGHQEFQSQVDKHSASKSVTIKFKVFGVEGFKEPQSMSEMMEFGKTFNQLVSAAGKPIKVELTGYDTFPEYSSAINALDSNTREALLKLTDDYMDYRMVLNNVDYMLNTITTVEFDWDHAKKDHVREVQGTLKEKLRRMESLGSDLLNGKLHYNDPQLKIDPWYQYEKTLGLPHRILRLPIPAISVFPLDHVGGDHDMDGHSPTIDMNAEVSTSDSDRVLSVKVSVDMKENRKDWTEFAKSATSSILDLKHSGLKVLDYWPTKGSLHAQAGSNDHDWHHYSGSGIIHDAYCCSDTKGKEDGKIGASPVTFEGINVILVPVEQDKPHMTKLASSGIETRGTPEALKARTDETRSFWFKDVPHPKGK